MYKYVLLLGFITVPLLAMAQDGDDRSTLLPDIDPQDIEIRGDFTARFPGLSRQPILGFNPKPRVFQMDPDRLPFIESDEDAVADITSDGLEQPYSPPRGRITYPERTDLFSRLGYGTHESPEVRVYGETRVSEYAQVSGDFNFLSSPGNMTDATSSFRYLDGRGDWIRRKNNSRLQLGLTGRSDFNYAVPGSADLESDENIRKDYQEIGAHTSFRHLYNAYNGWDLNGRYRYFQVENNLPANFNDEHYGRIGINRHWDGRRIGEVYNLSLFGEGSIYNTFEQSNMSWYITRLKAFYKRNLSNSHFQAGLDAYHSYDEVDEPINLYIFPNLKFHYAGFESGEVEFSVKSFVENSGLKGVHTDNRQLLIDPIIHNEHGLIASVNGSYEAFRGARFFGGISYAGYGTYSYYLLDDEGYSLNYDDDTNILEATFGFSYDFIPKRLTLYSDVIWRNSSTSEKQPVPFLEDTRSTASLYSNPFGNLHLRTWTEYRGPRPVNFTEENMDGYFLFGVQLDYKITSNFGAYIKGLNLLNRDYEVWQGYRERPVQVYGGLTLHI
ncbi:MAG: hypothetical protein WD266_10500 [Balneolales bacterium]